MTTEPTTEAGRDIVKVWPGLVMLVTEAEQQAAADALAHTLTVERLAEAMHGGAIGPSSVDGHWLCQGVDHHQSDATSVLALLNAQSPKS